MEELGDGIHKVDGLHMWQDDDLTRWYHTCGKKRRRRSLEQWEWIPTTKTSHPHYILISSTSHSHLIHITLTSHPHLIHITSTSSPTSKCHSCKVTEGVSDKHRRREPVEGEEACLEDDVRWMRDDVMWMRCGCDVDVMWITVTKCCGNEGNQNINCKIMFKF